MTSPAGLSLLCRVRRSLLHTCDYHFVLIFAGVVVSAPFICGAVPQLISAADVEFRSRIIKALGPLRRLPDAFWFLKDVIRVREGVVGPDSRLVQTRTPPPPHPRIPAQAIVELAVSSIRHAPLPAVDVLTVFEFHRRLAAAAETEAGRGEIASAAADPTVAVGSTMKALIDMGSAISFLGDSSSYSPWDAEDSPADILGALAQELGHTVDTLLGSWGDEKSAIPQGPDAAATPGAWPRVQVRNDSSLTLTVTIEPPAALMRTYKSALEGEAVKKGVAHSGKRRRDEDSGNCDALIAAAGAEGTRAAVHTAISSLYSLQNVDPHVDPASQASATASSEQMCTVDIGIMRGSIFVAGRYRKLARGLSQSSWFLKGKRVGVFPTSLEEEIANPLVALFASLPVPAACAVPLRSTAGLLHSAPAFCLVSPPKDTPSRNSSDIPACGFRFHAAGREDVDVRMLGEGRPCMVELIGCRSVVVPASRLADMARAVNGACTGGVHRASDATGPTLLPLPHVSPLSVGDCARLGEQGLGISRASDGADAGSAFPEPMLEVFQLRPASRFDFDALQAGSQDKRKRYAAVCWTSVPHTANQLRSRLDARSEVVLRQKTPMRVLHRRSLLTRRKQIYDMRTEWINPHFFILHMTASAGMDLLRSTATCSACAWRSRPLYALCSSSTT
jgi:hypothetical protein